MIKDLKDIRNDVAHNDPKVKTWHLQTFESELLDKITNLMDKVSQLMSISTDEKSKMEQCLRDVIEDVQNKEEILEIMRKELKAKYEQEVDLLFYRNSNLDNARVGSLKNFVLSHFLKEDQEIELDEVPQELKIRTKGLLIEGQAGTGKTSITWYIDLKIIHSQSIAFHDSFSGNSSKIGSSKKTCKITNLFSE